jgi:hypothetical protein
MKIALFKNQLSVLNYSSFPVTQLIAFNLY